MYEITTFEQYQEVKSREKAYSEWSKQFRQKNGWTVVPANETSPVSFTNDDRSALELWEWKHNPPDRKFLYIKTPKDRINLYGATGSAETWIGQKLGNVQFGQIFRDNFGGKRIPITVYGNNGVKYHGYYYVSSGDYARIKKVKNQ